MSRGTPAALRGKRTVGTQLLDEHADLVKRASDEQGFETPSDYLRELILTDVARILDTSIDASVYRTRTIVAQAAKLVGEDPKVFAERIVRETAAEIVRQSRATEVPATPKRASGMMRKVG